MYTARYLRALLLYKRNVGETDEVGQYREGLDTVFRTKIMQKTFKSLKRCMVHLKTLELQLVKEGLILDPNQHIKSAKRPLRNQEERKETATWD